MPTLSLRPSQALSFIRPADCPFTAECPQGLKDSRPAQLAEVQRPHPKGRPPPPPGPPGKLCGLLGATLGGVHTATPLLFLFPAILTFPTPHALLFGGFRGMQQNLTRVTILPKCQFLLLK